MGEHGGVYRAGAGGRVSFRPIRPDDAAFLYEVYASTRLDELAVVEWDEAHKAAFLHMQFAAQHQFYQERYTRTDLLIMLCDAVPVGRCSCDARRRGYRQGYAAFPRIAVTLCEADGCRQRHGRTAVDRVWRLPGTRSGHGEALAARHGIDLDSQGTAGLEYRSLLDL